MAQWMDLDDLTAYLKTAKSTLYKLVQAKKLPGHKVGRSWRFDRDEVDAWVKRSGMGSKGKTGGRQ